MLSLYLGTRRIINQTTSKRGLFKSLLFSYLGNWYGVMGYDIFTDNNIACTELLFWDYVKFLVGFFSGGLIGMVLGGKVEMIKMP